MAKIIPKSADEVYQVMKDYCDTKHFSFSAQQLLYIAEACYLHFESREWEHVKYWPAVAKKWILNNAMQQGQPLGKPPKTDNKPSVRDIVLKEEKNESV